MAGLTLGTAATPFASGWRGSGVQIRTFTGTGTDSTEMAAAVADTRYVIVGGRFSFAAAATLTVYSDATVMDPYICTAENLDGEFAAKQETGTGEALKIKISASTVYGWIAYMPITAGQVAPGY